MKLKIRGLVALLVLVISALAGCSSDGNGGFHLGLDNVRNPFISASSRERDDYVKANPGDTLAEMLKVDDTMVVGPRHRGVHFESSLKILDDRDEAVKIAQKEAIGSSARFDALKKVADLTDQLVANEKRLWEAKKTQIESTKASTEEQASRTGNSSIAQGDMKLLQRQIDYAAARLTELGAIPAGYAEPAFSIPFPGSLKGGEIKK